MKKDEILLFISALIISIIEIIIFKNISIMYYIILSMYMSLGFLTLGYFDYKKERIQRGRK